MANHIRPDTTDSCHQLHLRVPRGDDPGAADECFRAILDLISALQVDLRAIASDHRKTAPISSRHILGLPAAIAGTVLDWIGQWPS